jgi:hypothetical protein
MISRPKISILNIFFIFLLSGIKPNAQHVRNEIFSWGWNNGNQLHK